MSHSMPPKPADVWRRHIERQEAGNLTTAAYCQKTKLTLGTFRWWRSQLKRRSPMGDAPGFVMIPRLSGTSTPLNGVTILLSGNVRLIAYPQTDRSLLADAIGLLRTNT